MTHHILPMPITEDQVRALRVGDTVTLEETLYVSCYGNYLT